jgi:hypothetical protein
MELRFGVMAGPVQPRTGLKQAKNRSVQGEDGTYGGSSELLTSQQGQFYQSGAQHQTAPCAAALRSQPPIVALEEIRLRFALRL